jgi:hypothetical protein
LQILILEDTSIYQYLYQYCRYWKILVKYWYYQYCVPVLQYQYRGRLLHIIRIFELFRSLESYECMRHLYLTSF